MADGIQIFMTIYAAAIGLLALLPWLYAFYHLCLLDAIQKRRGSRPPPHAGLEPATSRLEGGRAVQLRQWGFRHPKATDYVAL